MAQFSRSSSSSVETHNSLSTILGTNLRNIDRPKTQTPEPKQNISSGSPCDSGIYGSSWTNDAANNRTKLTGGFNGDGRTSNSSMRSASVLSDCTSGPTSLKTDTTTKTVELTHTSPSSERNFPSSLVSELSEEQQLYSSEVKLTDVYFTLRFTQKWTISGGVCFLSQFLTGSGICTYICWFLQRHFVTMWPWHYVMRTSHVF